MQRRVNVCTTLGCPQCRDELVVTMEQVHDQHVVHCPSCGAPVALEPEDLGRIGPMAGTDEPGEQWSYI